MDLSLPPTKRIRICNDGITTNKHHLLAQPVEHLQLVISFLTLRDLSILISINRVFHTHVTKSEIYLKDTLHKYCKLAPIQTQCMYSMQMFNRNIAAILYESYYNFIANHVSQMKQNEHNHSHFELIPKKDIIPLNIYDLSQKDYFSTLSLIFNELGLWSHAISVLFHPSRFNQLCLFNDTKIFKAYSRLSSYNFLSMFPQRPKAVQTYNLVNMHTKMNHITSRKLNCYERVLFKSFPLHDNEQESPQNGSQLIVHRDAFMRRMNERFAYSKWKHFVDWTQFFLVGGSVLKCVLNSNWNEHDIDLDLFANNMSYNEYVAEMKEFVKRCKRNGYRVVSQIKSYKASVHNVHVYFNGRWQKFQFVWYGSMGKGQLMNVIDLDCTQICFDGQCVWCTYACIQSIATKTMISYKLVQNCKDSQKYVARILKYNRRGFQLIVPYAFEERFLFDAVKYYQDNEENINRNEAEENRGYEDFMLNNDTLKVRNKFIEICESM